MLPVERIVRRREGWCAGGPDALVADNSRIFAPSHPCYGARNTTTSMPSSCTRSPGNARSLRAITRKQFSATCRIAGGGRCGFLQKWGFNGLIYNQLSISGMDIFAIVATLGVEKDLPDETKNFDVVQR